MRENNYETGIRMIGKDNFGNLRNPEKKDLPPACKESETGERSLKKD